MKVSLVIPAYNEEKYLPACLESVQKSGFDFHQVIVVDNASTDQTRIVAEEFPRVTVVSESQKGLTKARQRGFQEARGEIIAYIDADCRMPSGWGETVCREFESNPNLVCLSGPCIYYDMSRRHRALVRIYWYCLAWPIYLVIRYMTIGGNFAIRREVLEKMNGFDTSISFYGEDTDIARRASAFGKVKFKLRFVMPTSGRRLQGQGLWSTALLYVTNFVSQVLRHKSATKVYKDIR